MRPSSADSSLLFFNWVICFISLTLQNYPCFLDRGAKDCEEAFEGTSRQEVMSKLSPYILFSFRILHELHELLGLY